MSLFDWFKNAAQSENEMTDISAESVSAKDSVNLAGLDFKAAIEAHQKWKSRLQACLDGDSQEKLDPGKVGRDDQCVLGKWIHGPITKEFANSAVFAQMKDEHAQFHRIAGEILSDVYGGRKKEAQEKLGSSFIRSSVQVQQYLAQFFFELKK